MNAVMEIVYVSVLKDNFSYVIVDRASNTAAVVDPVDPNTVIEKVTELGVECKYVLTTHNHWDHAGGNKKIKSKLPSVVIFGGKGDMAEGVEKEVWDGDTIELGNVKFEVLATPCHTQGHVSYYATCKGEESGAVFTGDTLFIGGCGNFNDGTPEMMYDALIHKLGKLPDNTRVYCGHEYTVKNLQFALTVEPDNEVLQEKLEWATERRKNGEFTIPSTIGEEKAFNPFMRCVEPQVQHYCGETDATQALWIVRQRKTEWGRRNS
eukprot:m.59793 g.59793  ORF g.59793 m.59793 type:complete len:265 (+) comp7922_c4_seq2:89-883(+)